MPKNTRKPLPICYDPEQETYLDEILRQEHLRDEETADIHNIRALVLKFDLPREILKQVSESTRISIEKLTSGAYRTIEEVPETENVPVLFDRLEQSLVALYNDKHGETETMPVCNGEIDALARYTCPNAYDSSLPESTLDLFCTQQGHYMVTWGILNRPDARSPEKGTDKFEFILVYRNKKNPNNAFIIYAEEKQRETYEERKRKGFKNEVVKYLQVRYFLSGRKKDIPADSIDMNLTLTRHNYRNVPRPTIFRIGHELRAFMCNSEMRRAPTYEELMVLLKGETMQL